MYKTRWTTVSRTTTRFYRSLWDVCSRRKRAEKDEVDDVVMWLNTTCKVRPHAAQQTTYISLLNGAHELWPCWGICEDRHYREEKCKSWWYSPQNGGKSCKMIGNGSKTSGSGYMAPRWPTAFKWIEPQDGGQGTGTDCQGGGGGCQLFRDTPRGVRNLLINTTKHGWVHFRFFISIDCHLCFLFVCFN